MKLFFLFIYIGVLATSNAASLHKNFPNFAATETPACSSDPSKAFLDVIVLIDTSANMGANNVRKIASMLTTIFQGFPIGNQWDITQGNRNTRIAVVTYDQQARVVANYTQINGINDLTNVVSGIQASSSQVADLYDGLVKAFLTDTNCTDINNCSECILNDWRPTAFLLFAASSNSPNFNSIYNIVWDTDFFTDGTFITINFNTADSALTNLLAKITSIEINNDVTASMYNFPSSNAQLTNNIIWSLTQANCYCGDFGSYTQYIYFDSANSRYARTRNCFTSLGESGGTEASPMTLCNFIEGLAGTPTFILSPANAKTIQDLFFYPGYSFYIGLHKNAQGQWSWYDFDGSEFPLGSYTNWAPGNPDNSSNGCAIITADATNTSMVWKTYDCSPMDTGLRMSLCQGLGCDTTSVSCCANCNGGNLESCKIDMVKRKKLNKRRKGTRHNLRW